MASKHLSSLYPLRRVGVIGTRPSGRTAAHVVRVDNTLDGTISTTDHEEGTENDNKDTPADHHGPLGSALRLVLALSPVVVEPEAAKELHALQCSEKSADERDETAEDGDTGGDDVGDDGHAESAAKPDGPVGEGVGGKMLGASEEANEGVLGGNLHSVSTYYHKTVRKANLRECRG